MIRKNTILSLLVACGLLLVGSAAYAQVNGQCNSIGVRALGADNQIARGINVVNNCEVILASIELFMAAGCDAVDDTAGGPILENGASCNISATICGALFTCFNIVPDFCEDVGDCTIPKPRS